MIKDKDFENKILELTKKGKKQKEIAKELNVTPSTISKKIRKMMLEDIDVPNTKERVSDEDILALRRKGLKMNEIAKLLNTSPATVSRRLSNMRERGINFPISVGEKSDINSKIIELKVEGVSQKEIAKKLNITQSSVSLRLKTMRKNGVPIEAPKSESKKIDEKIISLRENGMRNEEIAIELNLSHSTIVHRIKRMKDRGIIIPNVKRKTKEVIIDYAKIEELKKQGLFYEQIADKLGVSVERISKAVQELKEKGIEFPEEKVGTNSIDKKIIELRRKNATIEEISTEVGITKIAIYQRIRKMKKSGIEVPESAYRARRSDLKKKVDERKLAEAILKLQESKKATEEQLNVIAKYYNVDLNIVTKLAEYIDER